jgi:hypothetical protein
MKMLAALAAALTAAATLWFATAAAAAVDTAAAAAERPSFEEAAETALAMDDTSNGSSIGIRSFHSIPCEPIRAMPVN